MLLETLMSRGTWVAQLVKRLPSAQVMIPESPNRVLHRALLPLTSLLACFLSQINK